MHCALRATVVVILLSSLHVSGVKLNIDGKIDIGPKWSYEFKPIRTLASSTTSTLEKHHLVGMTELVSKMLEKYNKNNRNKKKDLLRYVDVDNRRIKEKEVPSFVDDDTRINKKGVLSFVDEDDKRHKEVTEEEQDKRNNERFIKSTKILTNEVLIEKYNDMYVIPHKVKNDAQITEFTKHIYKQSLKVFDSIKEKTTDDRIKDEIDVLARTYEEKFRDFVKVTQKQTIKTRLGTQKVIMNTLDTSNRIINRLMNFLIGKMGRSVLRNDLGGNAIQNEVNKKIDIEKNHICKKFGICRTQEGFSNFLVSIIDIIISSDNTKIRTVTDAITEVVKYTDFSKVMNPNTEMHFQKGISQLEMFNTGLIKAILSIFKNVILHKNKPIEVIGIVDARVNKTVGLLEIVDSLENALPPNETNKLEWQDLKKSLMEWINGRRKDIVEIVQSIISHIKKGVDNLDTETAVRVQRNVNLLLGSS